MKRIFTIVATLLIIASVWAQSPEKMSYQAVIRDANNALVTNQALGMQISILQGSATGMSVYAETQTPMTNTNGLVSLEIGTGSVVSGNFSTIDWASNTYYIKTETDPSGAADYTITGTSQLMSVPYALHAKTAENVTGTIQYTETDPTFGASIANGINAVDIANWNNHTVDTNTQLDSVDIANLGYVAGAILTEEDGSMTNELQVVSINEGTIALSNNGGSFQLPDSSATNELQVISISNDTIFLVDGGFVKLPGSEGITSSNTPVNNNLLTFDGTNWVAKNIITGSKGIAIPVNNMMPYLTLNYCFCLKGIYPSRNSQNPFIAEIMTFAGTFAPKNWTFCDGQLLSINSFPAAYSLVGVIYGGNGITTFGVPDLRGRTGIHEGQGVSLSNRLLGSRGGSQTNTLTINNLPAHNHTIIIQ